MRRSLLASLVLLGPSAFAASAQSTACVAGAPVSSYYVCPYAAGFTSILADPGTVTIAFGNCEDNDQTSGSGISIPFAFSYFGSSAGSVRPNTNGAMKFGTGGSGDSPANQVLPSSASPNGMVAPFWDDLKTGPPGDPSTIAYLATAASFVVEWSNMKFSTSGATGGSPGRNGSVTFQAALFPSGVIEFRYGPYTPPDTTACPPYPADSCGSSSAFPQSGPTATIGLESTSGTVGVDGTGFGGANAAPPRHNLRFTPATVTPVPVTYSVTATGSPPFASIQGLPGTIPMGPSPGFNAPATCPGCPDNSGWMRQPTAGPGSAASGPGSLPWPFTLFGRAARNFNLNTNGILVLGDPLGGDLSSNASPSGSAAPNFYIAPFWDDLEAKGTSFLGVRVGSVPPFRTLTFEWNDLGLLAGASGDCAASADGVRMQVVLFEASDNIEIRYDPSSVLGAGFSATAAVESATGASSVALLPGSANVSLPASNVLLDPCDCGAVRYVGLGCPGTGGFVPRIGTTGVAPVLGAANFGVTITDALGGAPATFVVGLGPLGPGGIVLLPPCTLWGFGLLTAGGGLTTPGPPGSGTRCVLAPIPPDPSLSCGTLSLQASVVDLGGASGLVAFTETLLVTIL
ncbi:MAG: hypothetical protein ACREIU_03235 [Planctomycetota bacterium]